MKKKLIYIEWYDAASPADDTGWWSEEGIIKWSDNFDSRVLSVGWIIKECKEYILLASEHNVNNNNYAHPLRVPKTWIKKRVNLTRHI